MKTDKVSLLPIFVKLSTFITIEEKVNLLLIFVALSTLKQLNTNT